MKARILTTTVAAIALTATGAFAQGMDRDRQDRGQQQAQERSFQNQQQRQQQRSAAQDISADELGAGQIMRIQRALGRAGFDVGPIDGNWGASTRSALVSFQEYSGLDDSGELNRETLRELGVDIRPRRQVSAQNLDSDQIEEIQVALGEQGFDVGPIDGNWGSSTRDAIENFQAERGLRVTGELNRETINELGVDVQATQGAQQRNAQQNRRQFSAQDDRQSRQAQFGAQRGQAFGETDQAGQRQRTGQQARQQQFAQDDGQWERQQQFAQEDGQWERQNRQAQAGNQQNRQFDRQGRQAQFDSERQQGSEQTGQMNRQQRFSEDRQAGQQQRDQARSTQQANLFVQQDLIGSTLRSQDGEQIGEVVDLSLNRRNGTINEVVVELDDGSMIAVPYDQVRQNRQNNRLTARMSAQELRNMDEFSYEETIGFGGSTDGNRFDL